MRLPAVFTRLNLFAWRTLPRPHTLLLTAASLAASFQFAAPTTSAQVVINGNTATASGDLSAGIGTLNNPINRLVIENATTVVGGRSLFL